MARWGELDAQSRLAGNDAVPVLVRQGDNLAADLGEEALDQRLVAGETDLEGIFENQRQQRGGGLAADNRPAKSGRQQVGDAADMVDVDVRDDQRTDTIDGEGDGQSCGAGAVAGGLGALK